jgi:2-keto-3-deoxy-L-rhamnonate aldolase RhmA
MPGAVNRLLEAGAVGIQMPRLRSRKHSVALYSMTHFPPAGTRSVGTANLSASYGLMPLSEYLADSDRRTLVIGQFETRQLDDPVNLVMQQLDVAFVGPVDLSVDFGLPGQLDHPTVGAYVRELESAAVQTDTILGTFVGTAEQAAQFVAKGYRFLAVSGDVTLLKNGAQALAAALRAACANTSSGQRSTQN